MQETIILLKRILYEMYGYQGWWPLVSEKGQAPAYHPDHPGRPVSDSEAFEIIVGSILTQNTSWRNVEKAIISLSARNLLNIRSIADSGDDLENAVRPSGYFRQKAARLRETALHITEKGGISALRSLSTERLRKLLLSWKGIGPETADSILCFAFDRPVFVVDKYTARLFEKLHLPHSSYEEIQTSVQEALQASADEYGDFHAGIVRVSVLKESDRLLRLMNAESDRPDGNETAFEKQVFREFQQIPGVGKKIAEDFREMGYRSVAELRNRDPEVLYAHLNRLRGCQTDRCMLYVFRCAVYYASEKKHDAELLKWWNWKDRK